MVAVVIANSVSAAAADHLSCCNRGSDSSHIRGKAKRKKRVFQNIEDSPANLVY
jgi:hypothetical protein